MSQSKATDLFRILKTWEGDAREDGTDILRVGKLLSVLQRKAERTSVAKRSFNTADKVLNIYKEKK